MLLRHRSDPSIIAAMAKGSEFCMKIKSSDRFNHREAKVGSFFQYNERWWRIVDLETDIDARLHYVIYRAASGNASLPPMD